MAVCSLFVEKKEGECSKETTDHTFKNERIPCIGMAGVLCRRGNVSAQKEPPHASWPPSYLLYLVELFTHKGKWHIELEL